MGYPPVLSLAMTFLPSETGGDQTKKSTCLVDFFAPKLIYKFLFINDLKNHFLDVDVLASYQTGKKFVYYTKLVFFCIAF